MYEEHFGLKEKPFALPPDPEFVFLSPHYRAALTMLQYGILNKTLFTLLTGEVGSGKTLLIRRMISKMPEDTRVGLISNTSESLGSLLRQICVAFSLDGPDQDDVKRHELFRSFLEREYEAGRQVLLIVDEAQNLGLKTLEELRMLSNVNADKRLLLQIILVGQPELREMLKRPDMRQLTQRISVDFHLKPLSEQEVVEYIRHRLSVAGGNADLFERDTASLVWASSRGIPRLINQICDLALVYAYAAESTKVDRVVMLQVIKDRIAGGLFPPPASSPFAAAAVPDAPPRRPTAPPPPPLRKPHWTDPVRRLFSQGDR